MMKHKKRINIHKKEFLVLIFVFLFSRGFSQTKFSNYEIGYFFDVDSKMINGYLDIDYNPEEGMDVSYVIGENFTPGFYYNLSGIKVSGLLKYSQNNTYLEFKPTEESESKKVKPEECKGYVIGLDSFAVIENFDIERLLGGFHSDKKEFAEVIQQFNNLSFYKHYKVGNTIVVTYLVKSDSSNSFLSFSKGEKNFKEAALRIFGDFDFLKKQIIAGKYNESDIPTLANFLKYKIKCDRKEKIIFNSSWDEIDKEENEFYYAYVESIHDSTFHVKYHFKDGTPIYEGDFTSFYPVNKNGEFKWYYPNGSIRKKANYINDKLQIKTLFFQNGNSHYVYKLFHDDIFYENVNNIKGENVLNNSGDGKEFFYDSIMGREITREFINHNIVSSYYTDSNGEKIYQYCSENADLVKLNQLKRKISKEIDYPVGSFKNFNHGLILLRFIVEPSGLTSGINIVKGIDDACDKSSLDFLSFTKTEKVWNPAKVDKEKVKQEVIVPITFTINGFSRNQFNYYYPYNPSWNNQMKSNPALPPPK